MMQAEDISQQALDLRLKGWSYPQIARHIGYTTEGARKAVQRGLAEHRTESAELAEEVREHEAARLDRMLQTLERIVEGAADDDDKRFAALDRLLKIQDRRAKLLGLDLQRLEVTGANGGPIAIAAIQRVIVDAPPVETLTARVDAALPAQSETAQALRVNADASSESAEITATCDDDNAE